MEKERVAKLIPIGSVVMLKNGKKPLMIYGVCQQDSKNPGKEFDYLGVLYPEGFINEQLKFLFDGENIEQVIFTGYQTPEREAFLEKLGNFYEQKPL